MFHSVIVSRRRRQIDPWEYLRDMMRRLPAVKDHDIPDLLPARRKPVDMDPIDMDPK